MNQKIIEKKWKAEEMKEQEQDDIVCHEMEEPQIRRDKKGNKIVVYMLSTYFLYGTSSGATLFGH